MDWKWTRKISPIGWVTIVVAVVGSVLAAMNPLLATDAICRHAPMAEAFAQGNWEEAFHPRFGLALTVVSGIVCFITRIDGLSASCGVATFAWALAILPVFGIARKVFGEKTAWFAVALYLACPQTLLWGIKGLREPMKLLGVLLCLEAVLESIGGSWRNFARMAAGMVLLAWSKVDAAPLMPVFCIMYAIGDRFRRKTWLLFAVAVIAMVPICLVVYDWTGYFLPSPQYIRHWRKLV